MLCYHFTKKEMSPSIFISYRHDDSWAATGRLYDRLKLRFSAAQVFMDVMIDPGQDFVEVIEQEVMQCDVLLAVIGPHWLRPPADDSRPRDFVHLEVGVALKRKIRVIPILVDGASMPQAADLPHELEELAHRHAIDVGHRHFDSDVEQLCQALERALEPAKHDGIVEPDRVCPESKVRKKRILKLLIGTEIILVLLVLAFFPFHVGGGLIHLLLITSVIMGILYLLQE